MMQGIGATPSVVPQRPIFGFTWSSGIWTRYIEAGNGVGPVAHPNSSPPIRASGSIRFPAIRQRALRGCRPFQIQDKAELCGLFEVIPGLVVCQHTQESFDEAGQELTEDAHGL